MPYKSIYWKLSLSYAGIALITALALGAVLLASLRSYYQQQELAYLRSNGEALSMALAPVLTTSVPADELKSHMQLLSFLSQIRVQVYDEAQTLLFDSDAPEGEAPVRLDAQPALPNPLSIQADDANTTTIIALNNSANPNDDDVVFNMKWVGVNTATITRPVSQPETLQFIYQDVPSDVMVAPGQWSTGQQGTTLVSVIPATRTMYGFGLQTSQATDERRTHQSISLSIASNDGSNLGTVIVSDGPAYGDAIVQSVARGWLIASLVAVLIAGATGWWISRRISTPIRSLTGVTHRMAGGDLSARAGIEQNDEIGALAAAYNQMADQIESTISALQRFASDAAHELHTPLTALETNLELAAQEIAVLDGASPALERAQQQARRLEDLTNDLLDLARIESASDANGWESIDLGELVAGTAEMYASQAEQAGIEFDLQLPQGQPVPLHARRRHVQRAVANLLENALKFTPPGGKVSARVSIADRSAVFAIQDTGIGIPAEDLPQIFSRFHRGRNAAGYPGSGLGLAIVQAIVAEHAGSIRAVSGPGQGTQFILQLPLSPAGDV
ncbi:MAG: HAMP domain-containing histidine kinase [Chloroflexi bacterium]|nr:HAMP domain-containing sensor histidine kinase [Anaerolineaceae bacterium]NMB86994.1 HAMP domain-containing histidine kinase [Chloroflexota bacterium]